MNSSAGNGHNPERVNLTGLLPKVGVTGERPIHALRHLETLGLRRNSAITPGAIAEFFLGAEPRIAAICQPLRGQCRGGRSAVPRLRSDIIV